MRRDGLDEGWQHFWAGELKPNRESPPFICSSFCHPFFTAFQLLAVGNHYIVLTKRGTEKEGWVRKEKGGRTGRWGSRERGQQGGFSVGESNTLASW